MSEFRSNEHSGPENPLNLRLNSQQQRGEAAEADEQSQPSVSDLQIGEAVDPAMVERHSNDLSLVDIPSMVEIQPANQQNLPLLGNQQQSVGLHSDFPSEQQSRGQMRGGFHSLVSGVTNFQAPPSVQLNEPQPITSFESARRNAIAPSPLALGQNQNNQILSLELSQSNQMPAPPQTSRSIHPPSSPLLPGLVRSRSNMDMNMREGLLSGLFQNRNPAATELQQQQAANQLRGSEDVALDEEHAESVSSLALSRQDNQNIVQPSPRNRSSLQPGRPQGFIRLHTPRSNAAALPTRDLGNSAVSNPVRVNSGIQSNAHSSPNDEARPSLSVASSVQQQRPGAPVVPGSTSQLAQGNAQESPAVQNSRPSILSSSDEEEADDVRVQTTFPLSGPHWLESSAQQQQIRQANFLSHSRMINDIQRRYRPELRPNLVHSHQFTGFREVDAFEVFERGDFMSEKSLEDIEQDNQAENEDSLSSHGGLDSDWSDADELLHDQLARGEEYGLRRYSDADSLRRTIDREFLKQIIKSWGALGSVVYMRSKRMNFDRRLLLGQSHSSMSKFSSGMSLFDIKRILQKVLVQSFANLNEGVKTRSTLQCLQMMDRMLPQSLSKMLRVTAQKYAVNVPGRVKELASIKSVIDFRIAYYQAVGQQKRRLLVSYLQGAVDFHKCLSSSAVLAMNMQLREWQQPHEQSFVNVEQSRKRYIDHYSALLLTQKKGQIDQATLTTQF